MKNILVPMANGAEDIELISIIDILLRAKNYGANINVICASLDDNLEVTLDTGMVLKAKVKLSEVDTKNIDAIALAGGFGGMTNLKNSEEIKSILQDLNSQNKLIAAICASPIVLANAGVLSDEFTCYPGCEEGIKGTRLNEPVVVRKNIITSAGPITSSYFALTIVKEMGFLDQFNRMLDGLLINQFGIKF